jgi:hypothetical protein
MGWEFPTSMKFEMFNKHLKCVIVFSHTTYADFYILLLYILAFPKELKSLKVLVKPQPFRYAGWILRYFGAIPSTEFGKTNGGSVDKIIRELEMCNGFRLLISPKGTIINSSWRSGYYAIANKIGIDIMIAGLDYEKKSVIIMDGIEYEKYKDMEKSDIEKILKVKLGSIVPLYPKEEVFPIRQHNAKLRSIITRDKLVILSLIAIILCYSMLPMFPMIEKFVINRLVFVIIGCSVLLIIYNI